MSTDSSAPNRGMAAYVITVICVVSALMQLAAGLIALKEAPESPPLLPGQQVMAAYIILSLGIGIVAHLAAGAAVFRLRTEALACMGYLLTPSLSKLIGAPLVPVTVLNVLFYLVLIYFTIRLFERSPALRASVRSDRLLLCTMVLLGLAAGHLIVLIRYSFAYPTLVRIGVLAPILVLAGLAGCVAFYAAVLTIRSRPERAKKLFLFAAVVTALQLPTWVHRWSMAAPFWLEVPIALFGFVLARRWRTRPEDTWVTSADPAPADR